MSSRLDTFRDFELLYQLLPPSKRQWPPKLAFAMLSAAVEEDQKIRKAYESGTLDRALAIDIMKSYNFVDIDDVTEEQIDKAVTILHSIIKLAS